MEPIDLLKETLKDSFNIDLAINSVKEYIDSSTDKSRYYPVLRALNCLKDKKIIDFCGHIRQCMNYFTCELNITKEIYNQIFQYRNLFDFIFSYNCGYTVNINPTIMSESDDLSSLYKFEKRRFNKSSIGDSRLYNYFGHITYKSLSQKMLIYQIGEMYKNETILACLPTGGGKSIAWLLSSISNKSLNIVIVPTVALAIDHERTSKMVFNATGNYPLAYYSGIKNEKKNQIYESIIAGTLPVLYISPEALLSKEFQNIIFKAAQENKVGTLFIDEAHLIVNWGISFRPEFQLLSTFRNKLKSNCTEGLKTVLLSATYTEEDICMIKNIFNDEIFTEYRADEQRSEPSYYMYKCKSEDERTNYIQKLVCQAPKPIIVYTAGPEEGKKYYDSIIEMGYKNVELFTGSTTNVKREKIIEDWNNEKVDIIVATSAFGMGVDKSDIRTIITAYIPETISRFYQEVGRAGRDGYSALNYFLYFYEIDNEYVKSLTKGTILTVKSLVDRWSELLANAKRESSDKVWLDINVAPDHLKFKPTGKRNAGWNKDVILMIFRTGLIEIIDLNKGNGDDYKILIHLKNITILENSQLLEKYLESPRANERDRIKNGVDSVKKMLKEVNRECYSTFIGNEFPFSERLCNGCPYCRKNGLSSFNRKGNINIKSTRNKVFKKFDFLTSDILDIFLKTSSSIMLGLEDYLEGEFLCDSIEYLIRKGINIIIVKNSYDEKSLLEKLSFNDNYKYLILTLEEAKQIDINWLYGICAVYYTNNEDYNQKLYEFADEYLNEDKENKIIQIAKNSQYINSENKLLSELIEQTLTGEQYLLGGTVLI